MNSLKDDIINELMARYAISKHQAEYRYKIFRQVDEIGLIVSSRRKR